MKGRPEEKALPLLAGSIEALKDVAEFDDRARELARRFWPGPLTLVLQRAGGFTSHLGGAADGSIAVRVPRSEALRELLELTGPLAVTSANRSGDQPAATLAEALSVFGEDTPALAAGSDTPRGEASTVLSLLGAPEVLREGALPFGEIQDCLRAAGLDA